MAEPLRVATWAGDFSRKGPGLLLRDLSRGEVAGASVMDAADADVLLLTDVDFDAGLAALGALNDKLARPYPHLFALRPNGGMPTDVDLDGDGLLGGPRDAQGYGWFSGQSGQALLSRWPVMLRADLSDVLWRDVPDSAMAPGDPAPALQRLSSNAHWAVDVQTPQGTLTLLTVDATPPVFDGPEDRNGRRNRDEVLLWPHVMAGRIGPDLPHPVVLLGNMNLDPDRGDGLRDAMRAVLDDPRLQDPLPGRVTVEWASVGAMRVSYVLPSADMDVQDAGVIPTVEGAGPHDLVWVDVSLPKPPAPGQ